MNGHRASRYCVSGYWVARRWTGRHHTGRRLFARVRAPRAVVGAIATVAMALALALATNGPASAQAGSGPLGPIPAEATVTCYAIADGTTNGPLDEASPDRLYRITDALGSPMVELVGTVPGATDIEAMELVAGEGIFAWDRALGLVHIDASTAAIIETRHSVSDRDVDALAIGWDRQPFLPREFRIFAVERIVGGPDVMRVHDFVTGEVVYEAPFDVARFGVADNGFAALTTVQNQGELYGVIGSGTDTKLVRITVSIGNAGPNDYIFVTELRGDSVDDLEGLGMAPPQPDVQTVLLGTTGDANNSDLHRISPSNGQSNGIVAEFDGATGIDFGAVDCRQMHANAQALIEIAPQCPGQLNYTVRNIGDLSGAFDIKLESQGVRTDLGVVTLGPDETYSSSVSGLEDGNYRLIALYNSQGRLFSADLDCASGVPPIVGADQPAEVLVASSCLAGNGRVDINIVNTGASAALYRIEFEGLSPRQWTVAQRDWWRMPFTGRADGDYVVSVKRSGVEIARQTIEVRCDGPAPSVTDDDIRVVNACRGGLGYVLFQFVNATASPRSYVISFGSLPNRSTTAAAHGQSVRAATGRPDGDYAVQIRSGSEVTDFTVTVDCS